ncbi:MAG: hypothetical protein ACXU9O_06525 [Gemmatimonadaceae bacterium]
MQLAPMGFYEERPPRHGHRTPSELAEDEMLSAVHGDFCGMPEAPEKKPIGGLACVPIAHVALLPWADAHPFTGSFEKPFYRMSGIVSDNSDTRTSGINIRE